MKLSKRNSSISKRANEAESQPPQQEQQPVDPRQQQFPFVKQVEEDSRMSMQHAYNYLQRYPEAWFRQGYHGDPRFIEMGRKYLHDLIRQYPMSYLKLADAANFHADPLLSELNLRAVERALEESGDADDIDTVQAYAEDLIGDSATTQLINKRFIELLEFVDVAGVYVVQRFVEENYGFELDSKVVDKMHSVVYEIATSKPDEFFESGLYYSEYGMDAGEDAAEAWARHDPIAYLSKLDDDETLDYYRGAFATMAHTLADNDPLTFFEELYGNKEHYESRGEGRPGLDIPSEAIERAGEYLAKHNPKAFLEMALYNVPELYYLDVDVNPIAPELQERGLKLESRFEEDNNIMITESEYQDTQRHPETEELKRYDFTLNMPTDDEGRQVYNHLVSDYSGDVHDDIGASAVKSFALVSFDDNTIYAEEIQSDMPTVLHKARRDNYYEQRLKDRYKISPAQYKQFMRGMAEHVAAYPYLIIAGMADFAANNNIPALKISSFGATEEFIGIANKKKAQRIYQQIPGELGFNTEGNWSTYETDPAGMRQLAENARQKAEETVQKLYAPKKEKPLSKKKTRQIDLAGLESAIKNTIGEAAAQQVDFTGGIKELMRSLKSLQNDGQISKKQFKGLSGLVNKFVRAEFIDELITKVAAMYGVSRATADKPKVLSKRANERHIKLLQENYPDVSLKPVNDLIAFLKEWVPAMVYRYMIVARTTKSCSSISPAFAEFASTKGFPTFVYHMPGHQVNVILTADGPIQVDLSAIQFEFCPQDDWDDEEEEKLRLVEKVKQNPFSAIKVTKWDGDLSRLMPQSPTNPEYKMLGYPIEDIPKAKKRAPQVDLEGVEIPIGEAYSMMSKAPLSKRAKVTSDTPAYKKKEKSESGNDIYRYDEKHIEKRWKEKKDKLKKLEKDIKKVRKQYREDLKSDNDRTRAIAAIVGIMDETAMRIGNEESAKEGTYGASTLKVKHVKGGSGKMTFDFPGKGAIEQHVSVENNEVIKAVRDLMKGKKADDFIFEVDGKKIWDRAVNRYLNPMGISAKDLRGFHANRLMKEILKKKDFKEALDEVADIVGHKASTLKNQYLDPELVEKHEEKKKKAALSIRAEDEELASTLVSQDPNPKPEQMMGQEPVSNEEKHRQKQLAKVDIDRNVTNLGSNVKFNETTQAAWRFVAPFLPPGTTLHSSFRSDHEQAKVILEEWTSRDYPGRGWKRNNGWYTVNFWKQVAKRTGAYPKRIIRLKKKVQDLTKNYPAGKVPAEEALTKREINIINGILKEMEQHIPPGEKAAPTIAPIGKSWHRVAALDVSGNFSGIKKAVNYIQNKLYNYLPIIEHYYEPNNKAYHIELGGAPRMPGIQEYKELLHEWQKIGKLQSLELPLSKRALMPSQERLLDKMEQKYFGKQQPGTGGLQRMPKGNASGIRPGVKVNEKIMGAWELLRPHLPQGSVMTSGARTRDDQIRIINNYWKKSNLDTKHPEVTDPFRRSKLLIQNGWIVGPPEAKGKYVHLKGSAFDVSGANIDEIAEAARRVSRDPSIPVEFSQVLVERKNNAVHIGVRSVGQQPRGLFTSQQFDITKVSSMRGVVNIVLEDLEASGAPEQIVTEYKEVFANMLSKEPLSMREKSLSIRAEDDANEHPRQSITLEQAKDDMGMGVGDEPGDWFEKSPIFRHREEAPEYETNGIPEGEARSLINSDPEKFFYRGLHREFPELEAEALSSVIQSNAKFYFVFDYHKREESEFEELQQEAAEALSQQDARAFFYYHLHHKFPELGRGAIIQLIDTNPDSFFDLGLNKDYPDYIGKAQNARNIKDPNKVELEIPEWLENKPDNPLSLRDRNATVESVNKMLSIRAGRIDYPKQMYADMVAWVEENASQLKRKLLVLKGKDKISKTFKIDLSDTEQYQKHPWFVKALTMEQSNGYHTDVVLHLIKGARFGMDGAHHYDKNTGVHEIFVENALDQIRNDEIFITLKHELIHLMQFFMSDAVYTKRFFEDKDPADYKGFAGLPGKYNPDTHKMYGDINKVFEDFEGESLRHKLSDIEFFTRLNDLIEYMRKNVESTENREDARHFLNNMLSTGFMRALRQHQPEKHQKAMRELYRAFDSMTSAASLSNRMQKAAKIEKKKGAGVFLVLPSKVSKQFPSLGEHDDSKSHITVLYIGKNVKEKQFGLVEETVRKVMADYLPFRLDLDEKVSYFPATKHSDGCKVAKMKVLSKELAKLHKELKKALLDVGIEIDDHFPTYKPHVTLEYMEPGKTRFDGPIPVGSWVPASVEIWGCGKKRVIPFEKALSKRSMKLSTNNPA